MHDLEDLKGAIEYYKEAIRINPKYIKAYINKGNVMQDLGDIKGAIKCLDQAIKINPIIVLLTITRDISKSSRRS
jgi:tetratricopeptide (TPR) repeat protein